LQEWHEQKAKYDRLFQEWNEKWKSQKELYRKERDAEVANLEATLSRFPRLGQLDVSAQKEEQLIPFNSIASVTSLQCLILHGAALKEPTSTLTAICNVSSSLFLFHSLTFVLYL